MTAPKSIMSDVLELADDWLGLSFKAKTPLVQTKTAALDVCQRSSLPPATIFLEKAYRQIDKNWKMAVEADSYSKSKENWRFTQRLEIAAHNNSPEVKLERSIVAGGDDHWANQIPTSSGLVGQYGDSSRCIDIVCRDDGNNYTMIELKVGSNNPLFAAVEVLSYGLLLAWSRNNADKLGYQEADQPIIGAQSIHLCVLAPEAFYEGYKVATLSESVNEGLRENQGILGIPFTFEFTRFGDGFDLAATPEEHLQKTVNRMAVQA